METVAVESINAASPSFDRFGEGVEEVEDGVVVLRVGGIKLGLDDDGARA
jgi:hypothetical protein